MRRVAIQASKRTPVFGMRFLTEEELKLTSVVACVAGVRTSEDDAASLTIRLCGDGGDTDLEPADDAIL